MAIHPTRQHKKSIENKNRIIDTARQLFETCDFDTVTVDDICQQSRVSKGTFYYYFKAKDDLLVLAFVREMDHYLAAHFTLNDAAPLKLQFIDFVQCMYDYACSRGKEWTRSSYIGQISTQVELMREGRPMVEMLRALISRGLRESAFRLDYSVDEFYTLVIGTFTGLLVKWCTDPTDRYDYRKLVSDQICFLLQ